MYYRQGLFAGLLKLLDGDTKESVLEMVRSVYWVKDTPRETYEGTLCNYIFDGGSRTDMFGDVVITFTITSTPNDDKLPDCVLRWRSSLDIHFPPEKGEEKSHAVLRIVKRMGVKHFGSTLVRLHVEHAEDSRFTVAGYPAPLRFDRLNALYSSWLEGKTDTTAGFFDASGGGAFRAALLLLELSVRFDPRIRMGPRVSIEDAERMLAGHRYRLSQQSPIS